MAPHREGSMNSTDERALFERWGWTHDVVGGAGYLPPGAALADEEAGE